MGVIKQGILGGFSNKVGSVVGTSWKGIAVMKSKPISVANPRTTPQVNQRNKMKGLTQFLSPILAEWIKPLVDRFAVKQSGFNLLTSLNIANMSNVGVPVFNTMKLSQGKLSTPSGISGSIASGDEGVTCTWSDALVNQYDSNSDNVYIAIYSVTDSMWIGTSSSAIRSAGEVDVAVTEEVGGDDILAAYFSFRRSDGTYVSDSAYLEITVA